MEELNYYQNYVWTCEECESQVVSDLTIGVEVSCDYCGSVCPEISEDMYAEAMSLFEGFQV